MKLISGDGIREMKSIAKVDVNWLLVQIAELFTHELFQCHLLSNSNRLAVQ